MHTFENIRAIGKKMTIYFDKIRSFHDLVDNDRFYDWESVDFEKRYNFLGGFKHLMEVKMSPKRLCPCDITQALALLAENDTLETLSILSTALDDGMRGCYSYQISNRDETIYSIESDSHPLEKYCESSIERISISIRTYETIYRFFVTIIIECVHVHHYYVG